MPVRGNKIFDTSSIICIFSEIKKPEIIHKIIEVGYKVKIPLSVFGEIKREETCYALKRAIENRVIDVYKDGFGQEFVRLKYRHPQLGNGEIETILRGIHCKEKNIKYYCILDDDRAKRVAKDQGLNVTGLVGLINYLRQREVISREEVVEIMTRLKASSFRV